MPNKFTIEQQIVRAKLQSWDQNLEKQAIQEIANFPSLWTLYSLKGTKFTKEEIREVSAYIEDQKKKYPDSLQELFALWENLVQAKANILTSVWWETKNLREVVEPNSFKEWLKKWITNAARFPFSFEYTENGTKKNVEVSTTLNTLKVGWRTHIFTSEAIRIQEIKMDQDKIYIGGLQISSSQRSPFGFSMTKKEFFERYLDDILAGRDIKILEKPIKIEIDGNINSKPENRKVEPMVTAPQDKKSGKDTTPRASRAVVQPIAWKKAPTQNKTTPKPVVTPKAKASPRKIEKKEEVNEAVISYKQVLDAHDAFMETAKENDKWLSGFRYTKEDIIENQKKLAKNYESFNELANSYIKGKWTSIEEVNKMKLNIAYYYSGDLKNVSSNNQLDIISSQNISIDILKGKVTKLPTTEEQTFEALNLLGTKNPKLAELISKKIEEQRAKGESFNLSSILSNPLVKWAWEKAYEEIYDAHLKKLDNELDVLKGQKYDTLSETEKKALNHLRDIRGKDGILDFTAQNREQMWQMLKYGWAIAAGIASTIPTGGASLWMLALGAGIGATVTTGWVLLAQWYRWSVWEVLQEAGINLFSFGWGAILFKVASWARAIALAEKTSKVLVYGIEWVGNIGIGVWTDMLRANLHGEDLDVWNSVQQNLVWAALPFAIRIRWWKVPPETQKDADLVENTVQAAQATAALGKSPKALLEKIKEPLDRLKFWGEKNNHGIKEWKVSNEIDNILSSHLTGDSLFDRVQKLWWSKKIQIEGFPDGYKIGKTPDGKKLEIETPNGKKVQFYEDKLEANLRWYYKEIEKSRSGVLSPNESVNKSSQKNEQRSSQDSTLSNSDQRFSDFITQLIHKKFPAWWIIKADGVEITKDGNKYLLNYKQKNYKFDSTEELANGMKQLMAEESERLAFLKSLNSASISNHLKNLHDKLVPWYDNLRWQHDGKKLTIERRNSDIWSWEKVEINTLTQEEQIAASADFLRISPIQLKKAITKTAWANIHEEIDHKEKESIIKKYWKSAWNKLETSFNKAKEWLVNWWKSFAMLPFEIAWWVLGWQKWVSWKKAIIIATGTQLVSTYISPNEKDKFYDANGDFNWNNIWEGLAEAVILKNFGKFSGPLMITGWGIYDFYSHTHAVTKVPSQKGD